MFIAILFICLYLILSLDLCPYSCRVYNSNSFLCRVLIVDGYLHTLMTIGHNLHLSIFMVVMDTGDCFPCVMKIFFVFTS